ncbi:MAG: acyl-CoA thioesterase [Rothia sp. (in: high G+C Gram-positive bacteria)]|nr:acyl-CoA thioesterase [Rothia sp. (in: high G+C Gram-positive bacteria)]
MAVTTEKKSITVHIPLRWADMDAYGHVNNAKMVQLLEEARIAVFGCPPSSGQPLVGTTEPPFALFASMPDGVQALIAEHHIKYLSPLPYRALPVPIQVSLLEVKPASIELSYDIFDSDTGRQCVSASTVLVFYDTQTHGLVRLSRQQRQRLAR